MNDDKAQNRNSMETYETFYEQALKTKGSHSINLAGGYTYTFQWRLDWNNIGHQLLLCFFFTYDFCRCL